MPGERLHSASRFVLELTRSCPYLAAMVLLRKGAARRPSGSTVSTVEGIAPAAPVPCGFMKSNMTASGSWCAGKAHGCVALPAGVMTGADRFPAIVDAALRLGYAATKPFWTPDAVILKPFARNRFSTAAGRKDGKGEASMNHSIYSVDKGTHLKIVITALVAGIVVVGLGLTSRVGSDSSSQTAAVVKAGKPIAISSNASITR